MSFKEEQSAFFTEKRVGGPEAMQNWLQRHYPRVHRIGNWTGDWGMGSFVFNLHLPEPDPRVGYAYGMAISHHKSANNPVGFSPRLSEFMDITLDIEPPMLRRMAQFLNDYANELEGVSEAPESTESDETPESE